MRAARCVSCRPRRKRRQMPARQWRAGAAQPAARQAPGCMHVPTWRPAAVRFSAICSLKTSLAAHCGRPPSLLDSPSESVRLPPAARRPPPAAVQEGGQGVCADPGLLQRNP